jgi:hypothetical protein
LRHGQGFGLSLEEVGRMSISTFLAYVDRKSLKMPYVPPGGDRAGVRTFSSPAAMMKYIEEQEGA